MTCGGELQGASAFTPPPPIGLKQEHHHFVDTQRQSAYGLSMPGALSLEASSRAPGKGHPICTMQPLAHPQGFQPSSIPAFFSPRLLYRPPNFSLPRLFLFPFCSALPRYLREALGLYNPPPPHPWTDEGGGGDKLPIGD